MFNSKSKLILIFALSPLLQLNSTSQPASQPASQPKNPNSKISKRTIAAISGLGVSAIGILGYLGWVTFFKKSKIDIFLDKNIKELTEKYPNKINEIYIHKVFWLFKSYSQLQRFNLLLECIRKIDSDWNPISFEDGDESRINIKLGDVNAIPEENSYSDWADTCNAYSIISFALHKIPGALRRDLANALREFLILVELEAQ